MLHTNQQNRHVQTRLQKTMGSNRVCARTKKKQWRLALFENLLWQEISLKYLYDIYGSSISENHIMYQLFLTLWRMKIEFKYVTIIVLFIYIHENDKTFHKLDNQHQFIHSQWRLVNKREEKNQDVRNRARLVFQTTIQLKNCTVIFDKSTTRFHIFDCILIKVGSL